MLASTHPRKLINTHFLERQLDIRTTGARHTDQLTARFSCDIGPQLGIPSRCKDNQVPSENGKNSKLLYDGSQHQRS